MDLEFLKTCLQYEPETGTFRWRRRPVDHFSDKRIANAFNSTWPGRRAGSVKKDGRTDIYVSGMRLKAHRLVWLFETGAWPAKHLDHINGDPSDNRICNLREATDSQNGFNRGPGKNNTSGYKGVYWDKPCSKWRAQIMVKRKVVFLGHFATPEDAAKAYAVGAQRYAGEFSRAVVPD